MDLEKISANKTARNLGWLYFVLSAITSFAFFYTHLPNFILLPVLGELEQIIGPILSGFIGVALFTFATIKWLQIYLHGCDNNEQRHIAKTAFQITFIADAGASFAYIFLSGNDLFTLNTDVQFWLGLISIFTVAVAVVFNFASYIWFTASSDASKAAIRDSNRRGEIQKAEEAQADYLDRLVVQKVKDKLSRRADAIAEAQASRIAQEREEIELTKAQPKTTETGTHNAPRRKRAAHSNGSSGGVHTPFE